MKDFFKFLLFAFIFFSSMKTFAYNAKEGNVSAILGPFIYKANFSGVASGTTSPDYVGTSLMAIGDISDHGSLELGIFYLPNKLYLRERYGNYLAERTQLVQITMGYRYWFTSYISGSLSFFSAYSLGNVDIAYSDFHGIDEPTTSARDKTEYGFDGALQYELWSKDRIALVTDVRYSRSVTSKEHEMADHYGYMLAVRYFIQEKQKVERPKGR